MNLLCAGHTLLDPYINYTIRKYIFYELEALFDMKIPVEGTSYLMGIPDPTGTLKPGEVFIKRLGGFDSYDNSYPIGTDVIICKFPLMRKEEIQKFTVVSTAPLEIFFNSKDSIGGIIVFSTSPIGNLAAKSLSGDYDGE